MAEQEKLEGQINKRISFKIALLVSAVFLIIGVVLIPFLDIQQSPVAKENQASSNFLFESVVGSPVMDGLPSKIRSLQDTSLVFILIPDGEYTIGTDQPDALDDEKPQIRIKAEAFYMARTEVTNEQYKRFVGKHPNANIPYSVEDWARPYSWNRETKTFGKGRDKLPITLISWQDALDYCTALGLRLPSEFEWEIAARGLKNTIYPWGDEWNPDYCNNIYTVSGTNFKTLAERMKYFETDFVYRDPVERNENTLKPVGSFVKDVSAYGLLDMGGNAAEWCNDWYDPSRYQDIKTLGLVTIPKEIDSREVAKKVVGTNQFDFINRKVIKGGSWMYCQEECKSTFRRYERPTFIDGSVGFRPAVSASVVKLYLKPGHGRS